MNINIPDSPYMIALGTSHTVGPCNGEVLKESFVDYVANELGLELIKIGMPGCTNMELLFSFNKLFNNGFINNKNMKLFLLEPRVVDATIRIPLEGLFDKEDVRSMILENLKERTFTEEDASFKREYEIITAIFNRHQMNLPLDEVSADIEQNVNNFIDGNFKVTDETGYILKDYSRYILNYADTYMQTMDNLIIVNSILNHLESLSKKYFWLTFSVFNDKHEIVSNELINSKLHHRLLRKSITKEYQTVLANKNLLCECEHMNEAGHRHLYTLIIDKIKEGYYDKTT